MARFEREESPWLMVAGAALTLSVVTAVSIMAGPAHGQTASGRGPLSWIGDITGAINQPAATPPRQAAPSPAPAPRRMAQAGSAKEWSGEDGASGHPLMTADAIRNSAANFGRCVAGFWPEAHRRGVSEASFRRFTADLYPDLRIMDLMDSQPEFTKSVWDYLDILVTDARIARGREVLAKNAATFAAVEKAYGVDRYIIAAIWGIESNYGTQGGDRSVLNSTATLACIGRRQGYFKDEFSPRWKSCITAT
jgi:membrane-bound lytic murein transglycosylase B